MKLNMFCSVELESTHLPGEPLLKAMSQLIVENDL